jgi:CO/xanthine dehydrogenase Mo-binding subunit
VSNAAGVRMTHVPMSPPRILKAIKGDQFDIAAD